MPKMKGHSSSRKRVKITGSGKIVRQKSGMRHNLEKKSSSLTRRLSGTVEMSPVDAKRFKKLLGR
jgi:large subunit ribosomal protein L35